MFARLLLATLIASQLGCGRTSQPTIDTMDSPEDASDAMGGAASGGSSSDETGGSVPTAGAPPVDAAVAACVAFCSARQLHIQHCMESDGDRALREELGDCLSSAEAADYGLCPRGPSCGGWLVGCLTDLEDPAFPIDADFASDTTCADSVAAGLFRPGGTSTRRR